MGAVCWWLAWGMLFGALPLFSRVQPTPRNGGVRGSWSSDCNGRDWPAPNILDDQDRCLQAAHQNPRSAEERGGLHLCSHTEVQVGVSAKHVQLLSEGKFSCPPGALRGMAGDPAAQRPSPPASGEQFSWLKMTRKGPLHSDGKTPVSLDWSTSAHSSHSRLPGPCTTSVPEAQPGPERSCLLTWRPPGPIPVQDPSHAVNPVLHSFPEAGVQAPLPLGFHAHLASPAAVCLTLDFGDSSGVEIRLNNVSEAAVATAYHQYGTEGVYMLKAVIYNEFHGAEVELGPYYMEVSQGNVSVFLNSSSVHKDEALIFTGSSVNPESTVVVHRFSPSSSYNVSFISQTQVGDSQAWLGVTIRYKMQPVSVYTNGTVFAADTDIMFTAVTKETTPLEFAWYFGDGPPVRTTLRIIKKRLSIPQRYHVTVRAASRLSSVVSEPHLITVQKKIIANRLMSAPSALVNTSVTFECRINFGTDVAYLWDFGDGTVSPGHSSSSHMYSREGEFTVEVLAFNNVSTAILKKHLFITREPCLPPLVKNMGSGKVQIWRSQPMRLGVTFEAAILCDISQGLSYTWSFMDSEGSPVPLPAAVNIHRQTIVLPGYLLEYGNYTALAKVQIKGRVVYSNFCVGVEVWARAPVSVISEGTHLFVPRTAASSIILRGSQSFDPDRPGTTLR
ncbi:polycystic kidney disease protein 1-like 1 [Tupaia chinensis]|uniref:polycystic kidney disease protein 1-like 1 n=1 Tax=Tupaia chinensis TaxID=246437 RepID=UPI000FFB581A|nr:polycystic kidney disease protein 1-like 1 [Tupaia chinensis]